MQPLEQWIIHRAGLIGLAWPDGVADACGLPPTTLVSIRSTGRLAGVGRSARGYLARALKVSVRQLEALAEGKIAWIDDAHSVDLDRFSPYALLPAKPVPPIALPCRHGLGVPILGKILEHGIVESSTAWSPEDGARLPVRYRGAADAFAFELAVETAMYPAGAVLAFRLIAPGELAENELALITLTPSAAECRLHRVRWHSPQSIQLLPDRERGESAIVSLGDVIRAARLIDAHPGSFCHG